MKKIRQITPFVIVGKMTDFYIPILDSYFETRLALKIELDHYD